jgi:hypothetical protein
MLRPRIEIFQGVGVAILRDTVIVRWLTPATEARVRWAFEMAEKVRVGNPQGVLVCQLIARSSSPPNAAARRVAQQRFSEIGHMIRCMVAVPLGDDLWTSLVRTIMRGVFLISGHSKSLRVVASEEAALDLLGELAVEGTPSTAELRAAITELDRALRAEGRSFGLSGPG